jgi:hypothetical protein
LPIACEGLVLRGSVLLVAQMEEKLRQVLL